MRGSEGESNRDRFSEKLGQRESETETETTRFVTCLSSHAEGSVLSSGDLDAVQAADMCCITQISLQVEQL